MSAPAVRAGASAPRSIVFVSTALTHGGAERQVVLLARGLAARGWRVRVVSMRPPEAYVDTLAEAGVEVASLHMARRFPDPRALVRLAALLRRWRPDIVHGHMVHANLLTRLARPLAWTPVLVSTAHNSIEGPRWREIAYRVTEPLCDLVTNVSAAAVERYIRVGAASASKIRYMANGLDMDRFRPDDAERGRLRRELGIEDRTVMLAAGRFEPAKDHATLLAALRRVVDRRDDVMLLLAGQGSLEPDVRRMSTALQLDGHVRFLGVRDDVPALMNASDVYVMSSAWEGLPLVLLEAASTGLPIVATDVGGNSDVVLREVNGLLVAPRDPEALADAVLRVVALTDDERRQWGSAGRALLQSEYDIEAVLDRWESLYRELWTRRRGRVAPRAVPARPWRLARRAAGAGAALVRALWRGRARPSARILTDSTMWQSSTWLEATDTVYRQDAPRRLNHRLLLALRLLVRRSRYALVMTTGNQTALYYGLLCRLLFLDPRHVVTQLYLDERRGLAALLHDPLMRLVLGRARGVIVPSTGEVDLVEARFRVPRERIRFLPYHTNITDPADLGCEDGYVFAGGRNFRDYDTLVAAVEGLEQEVVIVCGADQLLDRALPSNVRVHREIPWDRYIELLRGASVVVVPLSTEFVPSGQVAILEAMGYGKPVITTRSVGTVDYVHDGEDGLLYALRDAAGLRNQIQRLATDAALRRRLGHAAYLAVRRDFTFERHVARKLRALHELGGLQEMGVCDVGPHGPQSTASNGRAHPDYAAEGA